MTDRHVIAGLITGEVLLRGSARGPVISLSEPLSFWGGFDAAAGTVIDRRHPQCGQTLSGAIVVMTAARGSSSGSSVLAEAIRIRTAPAAFIVTERDAILLVGAMVALELYNIACPIVRVGASELELLRGVKEIAVDAVSVIAAIHTETV
jgi:uncharacterized protein